MRSRLIVLLVIFIIQFAQNQHQTTASAQRQQQQQQQRPPKSEEARGTQAPQPIPTASYVSLDGLTLVVIFDKPVNLSSYIELVERRRQNELADSEPEEAAEIISSNSPATEQQLQLQVRTVHPQLETFAAPITTTTPGAAASENTNQCSELTQLTASSGGQETRELVHGIQLCAKLLTKKTLRLLHKYRLHDCVWPSRVQFLIQLGKPVAQNAPTKISFQRQTISEFNSADLNAAAESAIANEREISLELGRLPLEGLGVPLAPKLAITGPNQVPSCGQFALSAHLSSPFGTQPDESVKLSWSVERIGFMHASNLNQQQQPPMMLFNGSQLSPASRAHQISADSQSSEARWRQLQQLVSSTRANNLVLDSQLLQFSPQLYEFRLSATFSTSLTSVTLNASHQVSRLDFETPLGAIYGSHILAHQAQLNTNQDLLLLADIQVPDCAQNIKQVGLYWQVSDSRIRFEQTYAPYYLARANTLPEQSQLEFRVNLFYGIRVKKFSSTSAFLATGESVLDAQISGGALVVHVGQDSPSAQLELFGSGSGDMNSLDKYTYQWSCFDGKTAQPCSRSLKSTTSASSLTDSGSNSSSVLAAPAGSLLQPEVADAGRGAAPPAPQTAASGLPLIDRHQQRQAHLRLPLSWLDPEAQLWFGLQRFERQAPGSSGTGGANGGGQQAQTEYALVELQAGHSATLAIGPVLVGPAGAQQRATLRNPLTGALLLLANSPAVVVGRLSPAREIRSFAWHSPNYMGQLQWTWRNSTNPITGQEEILTELHLSAQQQVAYAHSQIQLVACTRHASQLQQQQQQPQAQAQPQLTVLDVPNESLMTASLNLDTVQGVSQCRVRASLIGSSSLAVAVEHCNIPLGLSPVTYQIYLVDGSSTTGASSPLVAENNPADSGAASTANDDDDDDYANEADDAFFESQAAPLTMPQLSPVFILNGLNPLSLAALLAGPPANISAGAPITGGSSDSVRFGGRVCDRLRSCRSFYSAPVNLRQLLANWQLKVASASGNQSLPLSAATQPLAQFGRQQASSLLQSLQSMMEAAKRANMAGNSIGAISILNAASSLGQRLLDGDTDAPPAGDGEASAAAGAPGGAASSRLLANFRQRVRDYLQAIMRDSLHFGAVSLQRQFHYTDSGQASLVLNSLARVLATPESNIELKFRSLKLIAQLTRRTIQEQLAMMGSSCVADLRTIGRAYESIFGTFAHYAIDSAASDDQLAATATAANGGDVGGAPKAGNSSAVETGEHPTPSSSSSAPASVQPASSATDRQQHWANYSSGGGSSGGGRRKRGQEAALVYLKSVRQAYRSLLSAAAIQLPLGETHRFRYAAAPPPPVSQTAASSSSLKSVQTIAARQRHRSSDHLRSSEATAPTPTTTTSDGFNGGVNKQGAGAQLPRTSAVAASQPLISSDILSSLTHLTGASDLLMPPATAPPRRSIEVGFSQLGFVSITFDQRFLQRLATLVREGRLLCRNGNGAPGKSTATQQAANGATTTTTTTTSGAVPMILPASGGGSSQLLSTGAASSWIGGNCSSFVLALTSFAGKAPFRSLDEGQSLRVPHIELSLLSPLDGSDLLGQQQQREALMAGEDIKTEVTFTLANLDGEKPQSEQQEAGHAAARRRYKCYQFDEEANEWVRVAQGERQEIEQQEKRISCTFNGLGVFAAFQGKPPLAEAPLKSPVVIGLLALAVLITIISISLCCCSSGGGDGRSSAAGAGDSSNSVSTSDDGEDKRAFQRHPEQTHRSDFDYPRVGGG